LIEALDRPVDDATEREWVAQIGPKTAQYADGVTVEEYLDEVVRLVTPPRVEQSRALRSPLSLVVALDYLGTTWRLHCRRNLLRSGSMNGIASLAAGVGNEDEFSGRLSTLGDLLKSLQTHSVTGVGGHGLGKLEAYLLDQLPDQDDQDSIKRTLPVLQNIRKVRKGLQHSSAAPESLEAWRELGLTYPPKDWNDAWLAVRAIATDALMDLRDLVERLPVGGCTGHTN
jgi:hypothetical protein